MSKGEEIYNAILKAVSWWDLSEWLEDKGIDEADFDKFMEAGKKSLEEKKGA